MFVLEPPSPAEHNAAMTRDARPALDTSHHLETPEGTLIELHPAGLHTRSVAFLLDELIRWGLVAITSIVTGVAGMFGMGLFLLVLFLTYWLYGVAFEVLNNGVTPGKRSQGLRVVHDDGTPIRLPASMVRNLVLFVDLLPVAYVGAIVSIVVTNRFQRLGDLAAGTLVVHVVPERVAREDRELASPAMAAPFPLSAEEQSALVDYLERSAALSDQRADELAAILASAVGCDARVARQRVEQIALGVRGG